MVFVCQSALVQDCYCREKSVLQKLKLLNVSLCPLCLPREFHQVFVVHIHPKEIVEMAVKVVSDDTKNLFDFPRHTKVHFR